MNFGTKVVNCPYTHGAKHHFFLKKDTLLEIMKNKKLSFTENRFRRATIYTGCTQCATPKLPKKVLHIGDIVAHLGHCPEKIEMKFLIKNRFFFVHFEKRANLW